QVPGQTRSQADSSGVETAQANTVGFSPGSSGQAPRANANAAGRSWFDPARGYFWSAPDGHIYSLEGSNVGRGSPLADGSNHPGSIPMAYNVDGQFQGIVWLPTGASGSTVQWAAAAD